MHGVCLIRISRNGMGGTYGYTCMEGFNPCLSLATFICSGRTRCWEVHDTL